jgi:hypothetical protein
VIANDALFAVCPLTVTENGPEETPSGTIPAINVSLQPRTFTAVPLSEIVLVPWVDPKLEPAIVISALTGPEVGAILDIFGACAPVWCPQNQKKESDAKKTILRNLKLI